MLCFDRLAASLGMTLWSTQAPELHKEIIIAFETKEVECRSQRGFDLVRGWHSTWIKGPVTEGCGMHQQHILDIDPKASEHWTSQDVVIICYKLHVTGNIRPGIIPSELFQDAWWAYYDHPIKKSNEEVIPLHEYVKLQRDVCKTKIKHDGVLYPLKR